MMKRKEKSECRRKDAEVRRRYRSGVQATVIAVLAMVVVPVGVAFAAAPYNLLLIVADDIGQEQLAFYGVGEGEQPQVPYLTALSTGGVRFDLAWSNPICSPTRATIQTGRYGFRTGIGRATDVDEEGVEDFFDTCGLIDEVYLPEMLTVVANPGYASGAFGKWHVATNEEFFELDGADADLLVEGAPHEYGGYDYYRVTPNNVFAPCPGAWKAPFVMQNYGQFCTLEWDGIGDPLKIVHDHGDEYATTWTQESARSWIDQNASSPWLAYVAFHAPHRPFHDPDFPLNPVSDTSNLAPGFYREMIEKLDEEIGKLIFDGQPPAGANWRESLDNTVVIFVGDNGTQGEVAGDPVPSTKAKGTLFEGGVRVPMFITGSPDTPFAIGRVVDDPVNLSDLFATLAELGGFDGNAQELASAIGVNELDSVSLVPYIEAVLPNEPLRDLIYTENFIKNHQVGGKIDGNGTSCVPLEDPFETFDLAVANEDFKLMIRQMPLGVPCPGVEGPETCFVESFYSFAEQDIWDPTNLCALPSAQCAAVPQSVKDAYCELRAGLLALDPDAPAFPQSCCFVDEMTCSS